MYFASDSHVLIIWPSAFYETRDVAHVRSTIYPTDGFCDSPLGSKLSWSDNDVQVVQLPVKPFYRFMSLSRMSVSMSSRDFYVLSFLVHVCILIVFTIAKVAGWRLDLPYQASGSYAIVAMVLGTLLFLDASSQWGSVRPSVRRSVGLSVGP